MDCAACSGASSAEGACAVCGRPTCAACLSCAIDDQPACPACGDEADERVRSLGSLTFAVVCVVYLGALALGFVAFRGRPFVGGVAAVLAIALGRALQLALRLPTVTLLAPAEAEAGPSADAASEPAHVDASDEAR